MGNGKRTRGMREITIGEEGNNYGRRERTIEEEGKY